MDQNMPGHIPGFPEAYPSQKPNSRKPKFPITAQSRRSSRKLFATAAPQEIMYSRGQEDSLRQSLLDGESDVQDTAPLLRSTLFSREADIDDLEDTPMQAHVRNEQSMPLLVDSSVARRSLYRTIPLSASDDTGHADLEHMTAKSTAGGGVLDSVANMTNSILGAGIIGLPYAVSQAGFFTGLTLLIVICGITDWTIRLMALNAKLSGRHSYIDIMDHCFGSSGRAAVSFFQFAFAFGGMCAFGIIIGDTIPHAIRLIFPTLHEKPFLEIFANRKFIISLCTIGISYPLSLYRDIHKLARASGLALVCMCIIVISVPIEGPHVPQELKGDPSKRFSILEPGIFQSIGVISFAYVCHHNSLIIYSSLRNPTLARFTKVTHISTFISLVACITLAIPAFLVFTDKTQGNILNNFPADDTIINLVRFCLGVNMFMTTPLSLFVCREVIELYFFSHDSFNIRRHIFLTTVILFSTMLVALITCDLGVMLEITGGASATALSFIFPAICYVKLSNGSWHSRTKLPALACAAFGFIVMCISLFFSFTKAWAAAADVRICS